MIACDTREAWAQFLEFVKPDVHWLLMGIGLPLSASWMPQVSKLH